MSGLAEAKLLKITDHSAIRLEVLKDYSKCSSKFYIKEVLKKGFCLWKIRGK
jgi:hypothetical protein